MTRIEIREIHTLLYVQLQLDCEAPTCLVNLMGTQTNARITP
jgi:hypothetical protein